MNRREFIGAGLAAAAIAVAPEIPVEQVHISEIGYWPVYGKGVTDVMQEMLAEQEFFIRQIAYAFDLSPYMLSSVEVGESEVLEATCLDPADGTGGNRENGKGD